MTARSLHGAVEEPLRGPCVRLRLPDPREKPWLTVAELAAITGEGEKAIRAALDAGQLPLLQVGRYKRIPTAALLRMLDIGPEAFDGWHDADPSRGPAPTITLVQERTDGSEFRP